MKNPCCSRVNCTAILKTRGCYLEGGLGRPSGHGVELSPMVQNRHHKPPVYNLENSRHRNVTIPLPWTWSLSLPSYETGMPLWFGVLLLRPQTTRHLPSTPRTNGAPRLTKQKEKQDHRKILSGGRNTNGDGICRTQVPNAGKCWKVVLTNVEAVSA